MITLVKLGGGTKWHLYNEFSRSLTVCAAYQTRFVTRRVKVNDVWDKPVGGRTCIHCQQFIKAELERQRKNENRD